jgi:uncharacterized membrane protein
MRYLSAFARDQRGGSAAEFALVLPLLLIVLFGSIDIGRYGWNLSQAQKATQVGARWAAATDMIPSDLYTYSFATSGGIPQGTPVNSTAFPGVVCNDSGCSCAAGGTCNFGMTANTAAFNRLVTRMADIYPGLTAANVQVTYAWSGLGFAGDPNGADVAPLVTVSLRNLQFAPFTSYVWGAQFNLPSFAYSLPMEDGSGTISN